MFSATAYSLLPDKRILHDLGRDGEFGAAQVPPGLSTATAGLEVAEAALGRAGPIPISCGCSAAIAEHEAIELVATAGQSRAEEMPSELG